MRILIILMLFSTGLFAQTKLPTSGPISMEHIAQVMYAYGEISPAAYPFGNFRLTDLNANSHLADKTAPHSLSDWYGYTGTFNSIPMDTVLLRTNCPPGYQSGSGVYSMPSGAYTSTESQELANAAAQADMDLYAQDEINGGSTAGLGTTTVGVCNATTDTDNIIELVSVYRKDKFPYKDDVYIIVGSKYDVTSRLTVVIRVYGIGGGYRDYTQIMNIGNSMSATLHDESSSINKNLTGEIISVSPSSDGTYNYTY